MRGGDGDASEPVTVTGAAGEDGTSGGVMALGIPDSASASAGTNTPTLTVIHRAVCTRRDSSKRSAIRAFQQLHTCHGNDRDSAVSRSQISALLSRHAMFRDDHEAALARIAALEEELARKRQEDVVEAVNLERLERQLDEAKRKLAQTEEELDQYRPRPRPKRRIESAPKHEFVAASEPLSIEKPPSDRTGVIIVAVLLIGIVVVGLVLIWQSGSLNR
jgi:hypothetical protein